MKKKKVIILIVLLTLISISLIALFNYKTYYYISQINKNINAGDVKLLNKYEDLKETLEKDFIENPGFGGTFYTNEKDSINIVFSGFPDVTKGYLLTDIEFSDSKYFLYGIKVGDNAAKASEIIKANGFHFVKNTNTYELMFKKDKISVSFEINVSQVIEKIKIKLQSTNKHNVVF